DGVISHSNAEGVINATPTGTVTNGRHASYKVDDNTFARGYYLPGSYDNYYEYSEVNKFRDPIKSVTNLKEVFNNVKKGFLTPDIIWQESSGYKPAVISIEEIDDTYVATSTANCPKQKYSYGGIGKASITLDKDLNIKGMAFYTIGFGDDITDNIDKDAIKYWVNSVENIQYGDRVEGNIEPFDLTVFKTSQKTNNVIKPVEVSEGDISEVKVLSILENFEAYTKGATSATCDNIKIRYQDSDYNITNKFVSVNHKLYKDDKIVFSIGDDKVYRRLTDTDFEEIYVTEGVMGGYTMAGDILVKIDQYMNPNPYYDTNVFLNHTFNKDQLDKIVAGGKFGDYFEYEHNGKRELNYATCTGNTIKFKVTDTVYPYSYEPSIDNPKPQDEIISYEFTIVNNQCTEIAYTDLLNKQPITYSIKYNETLTEYPGEWPTMPTQN
ncbi:MAG: hypothetical protein HUJ61_03990, partial [Bacilli bacterium]|nr:hypothetical protein [Bacilli bacterium]